MFECTTDYCRHLDVLVITGVGLVYGAGVLLACYIEQRALKRADKQGR